MAASPAGLKEITVTMPFGIFVLHSMGVILAFKRHLDGIKVDAVAFLGISLGFLNLANHAVVHGLIFSFRLEIIKKHAQIRTCHSLGLSSL